MDTMDGPSRCSAVQCTIDRTKPEEAPTFTTQLTTDLKEGKRLSDSLHLRRTRCLMMVVVILLLALTLVTVFFAVEKAAKNDDLDKLVKVSSDNQQLIIKLSSMFNSTLQQLRKEAIDQPRKEIKNEISSIKRMVNQSKSGMDSLINRTSDLQQSLNSFNHSISDAMAELILEMHKEAVFLFDITPLLSEFSVHNDDVFSKPQRKQIYTVPLTVKVNLQKHDSPKLAIYFNCYDDFSLRMSNREIPKSIQFALLTDANAQLHITMVPLSSIDGCTRPNGDWKRYGMYSVAEVSRQTILKQNNIIRIAVKVVDY